MFKYIVKRLLISIIILLGVSVIIYTLVRLMPNDYVDLKFASQLQSGAIKQQDVDNFKKLYGLYTPEARIRFRWSPDGSTEGILEKDVRIKDHDTDIQNAEMYADFVSGDYGGTIGDNYYNLALTFEKIDGVVSTTYKLERYDYENVTVKDDKGNETTHSVLHKVTVKEGNYAVDITTDTITLDGLNVTNTYEKVSGWETLGTILGGYFGWLGNMMKGDLGHSFKYEKPVASVIGENMWISFAIAVVATLLQFLIAIPLGISSATHQYSAQDYIVTIFTMIGLSLPTYFFAAVMIKFLSVDLGWLPVNGLISGSAVFPDTFAGSLQRLGDMAYHLILPITVSVILSLGGLMRYTRTNMLEVLNADYIRTARAKGLSEKTVIYKHAFRNTLIPLATLLAGILPGLFGGMMITEQVFAIDGIGRLAYNALKEGDVPFVMGYNMFLAILTVIGTLLSDIMYSIVDPRVKLGR